MVKPLQATLRPFVYDLESARGPLVALEDVISFFTKIMPVYILGVVGLSKVQARAPRKVVSHFSERLFSAVRVVA